MRKINLIALGLAGALLTATATLLPVNVYAGDGYRSATTVVVGHRDRDRRGYDDRHRHKHHYRGHPPYGRAYGYYAPRYPTTYYRPYYRDYAPPRYYDYGRSGWEIDLHYYFRD